MERIADYLAWYYPIRVKFEVIKNHASELSLGNEQPTDYYESLYELYLQKISETEQKLKEKI
ncbi:MAG: hypothetical protein EOO43_02840 [Flavobacterium sp.]|nr:MAG: hypothetical protein EOO43_02840 [Flavobacterium sp.]